MPQLYTVFFRKDLTMKKILFSFFLLMCLISPSYATNWQWVTSTDTYSKYIDTDSIQYKKYQDDISSVTAWAKIVNSNTKIIEYVQLKLDFQNQFIETLTGRYDNSSGVTIDNIQNNRFPASAVFSQDNLYTDYYYYFIGNLEQTDIFKVSQEKGFYVQCTSMKDRNGKVTLIFIDTNSIRKNNNTISCYTLRVGLAPNNKPSDITIIKSYIYTESKQINNDSKAWVYHAGWHEGYIPAKSAPIFPNSIGESIYNFLVDYCNAHPDVVTKYNRGIPTLK